MSKFIIVYPFFFFILNNFQKKIKLISFINESLLLIDFKT